MEVRAAMSSIHRDNVPELLVPSSDKRVFAALIFDVGILERGDYIFIIQRTDIYHSQISYHMIPSSSQISQSKAGIDNLDSYPSKC